MKIAILGYGKEGQAVEAYFQKQGASVQIFDNFTPDELANFDLTPFDLVFRSPSVPLYLVPGVTHRSDGTYSLPANLTSCTKYFFAHCPASIIGVTGTKGKGTTCAMTAAILEAAGRKVHFLGNVGTPAISALDEIQPTDLVVYELSSFQLWDLDKSPQVAVVLRIEPDHLDKHADFADYVAAKSNIVRYQTPADTCIYFKDNATSAAVAELSPGKRITYPDDAYVDLTNCLTIPGAHNRENAQAALLAAEAGISAHESVRTAAKGALAAFKGLPHHIELIRTLSGVDYYDDSFSASFPALDVALAAFADRPTILIAGGKNRNLDLTETKSRIFSAENLAKAIFIGETAPILAEGAPAGKCDLAPTLDAAIAQARSIAEALDPATRPVVLLSPGAASFDMFKNFYDRGEQFQKIVGELT